RIHPAERPYHVRTNAFRVTLPAQKSVEIFINIKTTNIMHTSMRLFDEETFYQGEHLNQWMSGLYYGTVLALLFYNFFLFVTTRDARFFSYCVFVALVSTTLFIYDGLADLFVPVGGWEVVL